MQGGPTASDGATVQPYKLKYAKYLQVKPLTGSPFDTLIAATQVRPFYNYFRIRNWTFLQKLKEKSQSQAKRHKMACRDWWIFHDKG